MSISVPVLPWNIPPSSFTAPVSLILCLLASLGLLLGLHQPKSQFTRVGKPWLLSLLSGKHAMSFTMEHHVAEGYRKVIKPTNRPFVMKWWARDYNFLPPKYLVDFKRAGTHSLSFFENLSTAFSMYASVGDLYSSDLMVDVVKRGINVRLPKLVPLLSDECDYAFRREIGGPKEWKAFTAAQLSQKIMHRVTSRILIGTELCRDENYLRSSTTLNNSVFINGLVMTMLPLGPLRRLGCHFFSFLHRRNIRNAMKDILPVVTKRFEEFQNQDKDSLEALDAIQWSLEFSAGNKKEHNPEWIALSLLHNLWAGSAAPAGLVTQMIFQTLLEPQYLDPLRSEAVKAIGTYGWTDKALSSMPLIDSFIRELNRLYPTGAVTCARTVMDKTFQFHDGFQLPRGSRIAIPALAIHTDPDNFPDPMKFDGFRFAKMNTAEKSGEETEAKWGASTVSETNLAFGFGKHSCTGRFYAVRKAKLIFSKLIMQYDLKWEGVMSMPPRLSINGQFAANQLQKIFLKQR
ncbi:putative cytochrome P450 monooxygenase [Zopfia rhizophila CBS 207.26]|uniref:Putative cytochrome P450 monooxygenase n=1 Tax=Zopfia rhizophila CBS 207.26 TaxID=1314779 RepID=A0A6A6DIC5_9PEZI|nr:putative cytochrome P450 monooxygenase [Zopfia rhizophila CBS 207.26]